MLQSRSTMLGSEEDPCITPRTTESTQINATKQRVITTCLPQGSAAPRFVRQPAGSRRQGNAEVPDHTYANDASCTPAPNIALVNVGGAVSVVSVMRVAPVFVV